MKSSLLVLIVFCGISMTLQGNPGYSSTPIQPAPQPIQPSMGGYFGSGNPWDYGYGPWNFDYGYDDYGYDDYYPRRHRHHHNSHNNNNNNNNDDNCNDNDNNNTNGNDTNTNDTDTDNNSTDPNFPIDIEFPSEPGNNISPTKCRIGGAYRHLCLPRNKFDSRELDKKYHYHYSCRMDAICGYKQGKCQWLVTNKYRQCISNLKSSLVRKSKIKPVSNRIVDPVYNYKPTPSTNAIEPMMNIAPSNPTNQINFPQVEPISSLNQLNLVPYTMFNPNPVNVVSSIPILTSPNELNSQMIGRSIAENTQRLMPAQLRMNLH